MHVRHFEQPPEARQNQHDPKILLGERPRLGVKKQLARDLPVPRLVFLGWMDWSRRRFGPMHPSTRLARMANPFEFLQAVRSEAAKITWPSRRETLITTGLVFVMVLVACLFFVAADAILQAMVRFVLGLGH
jgi:preprotein translocase subunit SecE